MQNVTDGGQRDHAPDKCVAIGETVCTVRSKSS